MKHMNWIKMWSLWKLLKSIILNPFQELKESHELDENEVVMMKASKMDEGIDHGNGKTLIRQESENLLMMSKPRHKAHHKPLARTHSSPLVTFPLPSATQDVGPVKYKFTTGNQCFLHLYNFFMTFNPFPHTTILQQTTLNIFCQKMENLNNWIDNLWLTLWLKEKIACFEQFLLLSRCFRKAVSCRGVIKRLYKGKG